MASPFEAVTQARPASKTTAGAVSPSPRSGDSGVSASGPPASTSGATMPPPAPSGGPATGLLPTYVPAQGPFQSNMTTGGSSYLFAPGASGEIMSMLGLAGSGSQAGGNLATAAASDALKTSIRNNPNVDPSYLASLLENTQLSRTAAQLASQPASMPAPLTFTQPMMPTPTSGMAPGPGAMGPPPAVMTNPALAALQDHDPMKRNRSSGLTNMMVVPDGKAQRTRSGQQPYGPLGAAARASNAPAHGMPPALAPPAAPEPEITPEVKSHTARSLLRMLRAGTGVRTKNDVSIVEAEALCKKLAGEFAPVEVLKTKKRNAGRESLSVLLSMYLQRPISIAEAARCFHNPTNRGLEPTDRLWELLGDKCWPPFPEDKPAKPPSPHPATVANAAAAQRAHQAKLAAQMRQNQAQMGYHPVAGGAPIQVPMMQNTAVTGADSASPFAAVVSAAPSAVFRPPQQSGMMMPQGQRPPQLHGTVPQVFNMGTGTVAAQPAMLPGTLADFNASMGMPAMGGMQGTTLPLPSGSMYQQPMNFAAALSKPPTTSASIRSQGLATGQSNLQGVKTEHGYNMAANNQPPVQANGSGDSSNWSEGPFTAYAESTGRTPSHQSTRNNAAPKPSGNQAAGPTTAASMDVTLSSLLSGGTLQQLSAAVNSLHNKGAADAASSQAPPSSAAQATAVSQPQGAQQPSATPTFSGMFNELLAEHDLSREATLSGILGTGSLTSAAAEPTLQQLAAAAKNSKSGSNGSGSGLVHPASLSSELDFESWPELRS